MIVFVHWYIGCVYVGIAEVHEGMDEYEECSKTEPEVKFTDSGIIISYQHGSDRTSGAAGGCGRTSRDLSAAGSRGGTIRDSGAAGRNGSAKRLPGCQPIGLVLRCGHI